MENIYVMWESLNKPLLRFWSSNLAILPRNGGFYKTNLQMNELDK